MAPEKKEDIVCAFHGDLEVRLERIETKIDGIKNQLNNLNLWRVWVVGYSAGVAAATALLMKILKVT